MTVSTILLIIAIALFFFGSNVYISCRMFQGFHAVFPNLSGLWFGIVCAVLVALAFFAWIRPHLVIPVPRPVRNALALYGAYWIGTYVYLLLTLLAADLVLLLLGALKLLPLPAPETARLVSDLAALAVTAVILVAGTVHADTFVYPSYEVRTERITDGREWNIVLVSDLHLGAVNSEKRLTKLVDGINAGNPDIVCIAGDIFDNDFASILNTEKCARTLKSIRSKYGVYACLGNHDTGSTRQKMIDFLPQCGITLLDERYTVIDGQLILAGRMDASSTGGDGAKKRGAFGDVIAGADAELPLLVLDHNPAHIDEYPDRADLILCGHTHRGQIFPGSLFTRRLFTVDHGLYRRDEHSPHVIVTSGAGTWGMPMRVGSDSEIVSIRFTGK